MRIRTLRYEDVPTLTAIQRSAAEADGQEIRSEADLNSWLMEQVEDALANTFVVTDDDDELQTWGQAGTLEGIEGEIIGYTVVQCRHDEEGYHLSCQGCVHPDQRGRNAGRALLICALNRARLLAEEFEFEAESQGVPIYFEVFLPVTMKPDSQLTRRCELSHVDEGEWNGFQLYRYLL